MDTPSSGELLLDQQRYEDAVEKFDKAVELEKNK
jgi:import receptor subunit TOM70